MTYTEAIQFLFSLQMFGAKPGLERTRRLATHFGNPHEQLRFIHVAGTNGKGSTCAMLESIYRTAGLRVGLFTSPHLISFRERIQVNRKLIPAADVARLTAAVQAVLPEFLPDEHPTMFEVVTVMALRYFLEEQCDLVIWETGLGGRLDATNIVTPLASAITSIGLDHQRWLGDTLPQIAAEKAGIIKPGIPVITSNDTPDVLEVISSIALTRNAPLKTATLDSVTEYLSALSLPGPHQKKNAALAVATVQTLQTQIAVSPDAIETGLRSVNWPGRMQLIQQSDGRKWLIDGAHNEAGIAALLTALEEYFPGQRPTLILGLLSDKHWREIVAKLTHISDRIFTVPVTSHRTVSSAELAAECRRHPQIIATECGSLTEAFAQAAAAPFVLVTGSLYLVGEALELLGYAPPDSIGERALNEWRQDQSAR